MVTFCSRCGSLPITEEDDGEEQCEVCPRCKTDQYITQAANFPVIEPSRLIVTEPAYAPFNEEAWLLEQKKKEDAQDERIKKYQNDFALHGQEVATKNYFNKN